MTVISPLQDATEALRIARRALPYSQAQAFLAEYPYLAAAVDAVIEASATAHVAAPALSPGERRPEDLPESALFIDDFDERPQRRLKDVWEGRGDYNDAFVPDGERDEELLAKRLRADSDKSLDLSLPGE